MESRAALSRSFLLLLLTLGVECGGGLRFGKRSGEFKILQVADMHYADGRETGCLDVLPDQLPTCSDLNTTAFTYRVIRAENPDLLVFTGDNIFGFDSTDAAKSLGLAFAPAIALRLPWAAVLGNHDQEGSLSREGVMRHIVGMAHTLSRLNPPEMEIDGFGNYNLEVAGAEGSSLSNKSVLNLYFVDSGDYSTVPSIPGYGWIKPSQQVWFQHTSSRLQKEYTSEPEAQKHPAPGLMYFHIPLPEYNSFDASNFTGVKMEAGISSASINSGFFTTMVESGDVKAVFTGHDHLNDFCGKLTGINLCYAGGFGYHAYGKAGWSRRARVVSAYLEKTEGGDWGGVKFIKTWKRLDDRYLSTIDTQVLWNKGSAGNAANEIVNFINENRTASKLAKLYNSPGLGCMALQYTSLCSGNCSSNNTLKCKPPEVDITEVYAPNCGVELPTVDTISGHIASCRWKYLDPEQAFSEILIADKKSLSLLSSKDHTEVGVGLRREHQGAFFWCVLFSSGKSNTTFVLEGGRGIDQRSGCFSGTDLPCSAGKKVIFFGDLTVHLVFIVLLYLLIGI